MCMFYNRALRESDKLKFQRIFLLTHLMLPVIVPWYVVSTPASSLPAAHHNCCFFKYHGPIQQIIPCSFKHPILWSSLLSSGGCLNFHWCCQLHSSKNVTKISLLLFLYEAHASFAFVTWLRFLFFTVYSPGFKFGYVWMLPLFKTTLQESHWNLVVLQGKF